MLEIERNVLEKLKCSLCNGFLSTSPVTLKTNGENLCGNCSIVNDEEQPGTRNEVYEYFATIIQFPCRYEKYGCKEKLNFGFVGQHENGCIHRLYECPLSAYDNDCVWQGKTSDVKEHFKQMHNDLIVPHPYTFNPIINSSNEKCVLVEVFNVLFLIQMKCNTTAAKLWFCVRFIGNPKFASLFTYKLKTGDGENNITMRNDVNTCETLMLSRNNVIEVDINSLLKLTKSIQNVMCTIKIKLKNKNCMVCLKNCTGSKIFFCENGYYCTFCSANTIQPCKFNNRGCDFKDNARHIPKHEVWFCKLTEQICSYDPECKFKILKNTTLMDHVILHHFDNKLMELVKGNTGAMYMHVNKKYEGCLSGYNSIFVTNNIFTCTKHEFKLHFKIISNLPKKEISKFECQLKLFNSVTNYSMLIDFLVDVESVEYDWYLTYTEKKSDKDSVLRKISEENDIYTYNYRLTITSNKTC